MQFSKLQSLTKVVGTNILGPTRIDANGVQYNLISDGNERKFHILDDAGLVKERQEIDEARLLVMSMRDDPRRLMQNKSIQTGNASKSKKEASIKFEEALITRKVDGVDPAAAETLRKLIEKDEEEQASLKRSPDPEFARNAIHPGSWSHVKPSGLGVEQLGDDRVRYSMKAIKDKFHENVDIIEELYHEREALKTRVKELEDDLIDPERAAWIVRASKYGLPVSSRKLFDEHSLTPRPNSARSKSPRGKSHSLQSSLRPNSARDHTSASRAKQSKQAKSLSAAEMASKFLESKRDAKKNGPSKNLIADMDRYVQKRREVEIQEEAKAKEKEKEMQAFQERQKKALQRAANAGHASALEKRAKAFEERKKEKLDKLRKDQDKDIVARRELFSKEFAKHIQQGPAIHDMTYDAQLELEAQQRKERIERRKNELLFSSKAPIEYDPLKKTLDNPVPISTFVAKNPSEVMEKLNLHALRWENHLEDVKDKLRQKKQEERMLMGTSWAVVDPTKSMTARQEASKARRDARIERRQQAESARNTRLIAQRRQELLRLANTLPPESGRRMTAAAEKRARLVRNKLEVEREQEVEENRKRSHSKKENNALITNLRQSISAQEASRKSSHGNFVEMSGTKAMEKAAQSEAEARDRARQNKQRIQEALKNRMSLYDRHRLELEKQAAADRALGIVKGALLGDAMEKENRVKKGHQCKEADAKGYSRFDNDCNEIDFKLLQMDSNKLKTETMLEILDGKEKALLGLPRDMDAI